MTCKRPEVAQSYLDQAVRIDPEEILVGNVDDDVEDDVDDVDVEDDDGDGDGDDNNQLTMSDQLISDFDFEGLFALFANININTNTRTNTKIN